MWISEVRLVNFRGFDGSGPITLSRTVNVIIGRNNSGKSTIIHGIYLIQNGTEWRGEDTRLGVPQQSARVIVGLEDLETEYLLPQDRSSFRPSGPYLPRLIRMPPGLRIASDDHDTNLSTVSL